MSERDTTMRRMYFNDGFSMGEIAKQFGISRQRVHQIIGSARDEAHYGRARKEKRLEELELAYSKISAGESTVEKEATRLGIDENSLRTAWSRMGLRLTNPSPLHGTHYRYSRGCRCEECKEAAREERRKRYESGPKIHGTVSAYINYGCRCDECRKAGSQNNRETRIRRILREKERMPVE